MITFFSFYQVAQFVSTLPGVRSLNNEDICQRIIEEDIDGSAFMLLSQFDLVKLGLKLGPAIKVFNTVLRISSRTTRDLLNDNSWKKPLRVVSYKPQIHKESQPPTQNVRLAFFERNFLFLMF